jgi:hypothetical protein
MGRPHPVSELARSYLKDPAIFSQRIIEPVLIWELPPAVQEEDFLLGTTGGSDVTRPSTRDPLVFDVRKVADKSNAFALGITVGRAKNNDIVVADNSVSRFHAYLQKAAAWSIVDAESRNGTSVDGMKLTPNQHVTLRDGAALRIGKMEMQFMLPERFISWLKTHLTLPKK